MANMSTVARALAHDPYPPTPAFAEDMQFLAAYLGIHMLSVPSRRYAYLLWAVIGLIFTVLSLSHVLGAKGGVLGAYWSKFALRRRAWKTGPRSRRRTLLLFPSNGQIVALTLLFACISAASCVGPDYIIPSASTFDLSRRSFFTLKWDPSIFVSYAPQYTIQKAWWTAGGRVGMIAFSLFPLCILFALKAPPFAIFSIPHLVHLSFDKLSRLHRWTGWLIWILSALHVAFWSIELWQDRRPNVFADSSAQEQRVYGYAWSYYRFIFAWGAFSLFTILMLSTLSPLRRHHYETFYFFHITLVPATIVLAALHHPPLWQWCWAALGIWVAERTWRLVRWTWINGVIGKHTPAVPPTDPRWSDRTLMSPFDSENGHSPGPNGINPYTLKNSLAFPMPSAAPSSIQASVLRQDSPATGRYPPTPFSPGSPAADPRRTSFSSDISTTDLHSPMVDGIAAHTMNLSYTPPPGFAHAELLAGHTIRLTLTPARQFSWAPGQHFLLLVPHVSSVLTHPFTTASCYDKLLPDQEGALVFLIRAKAGWTRELWNTIAVLNSQGKHIPPGEQLPQGWAPPKKGVVMRALVDGPFGSSGRVRWDNYSTAIILVGGSGISFGLSVLDHLCLRMAGRDAASLAGKGGQMKMRRVRFVWLIREYSHLQWCSSTIRRCLEALPFPALQLDIFVTNAAPEAVPRPMHPPALDMLHSQPPPLQNTLAPTSSIPLIDVMSPVSPTLDPIRPVSAFPSFVLGNDPDQSPYIVPGPEDINHLRPPKPGFARNAPSWMRGSLGSTKSASTGYSAFDLSYYQRAGSTSQLSQLAADAEDIQREEEQEIDIADLTNWDGENDSGLMGESRLSKQIMKAGNKRRFISYRNSISASNRGSTAGDARASSFSNAPQAPGMRPDSTVRFSAGVPPDLGHNLDHGRLIHGRSGLSAAHAAHSRTSLLMPSPIAEGSEVSDDEDGASTAVHSRPSTPVTYDARSSIASSIGLIPGLGQGTGHRRTQSEAVAVEVERRELRELARVAEFAHPGKPNIHALIREEVEHSAGAIVVGVCGPITLNTVVRNAVATAIQPGRIWRGDERGRIDLVSEDFEY